MMVGTESPQWAKDLVDHWVVFNDHHHGIDSVTAFVFYTDFFEHEDPKRQVRIFAIPFETAAQEDSTGAIQLGLYATYIQPDEYEVIDTPKGLEKWTDRHMGGPNA
jgi:hypothetical protein